MDCLFSILLQILASAVFIATLVKLDEIQDFNVAIDTFTFGVPRTIKMKRRRMSAYNAFASVEMIVLPFIHLIMAKIQCSTEEEQIGTNCEYLLPLWYPVEIMGILKNYILLCRMVVPVYVTILFNTYIMAWESMLIIASRIRHFGFVLSCMKFEDNVDVDMKKLQFCIRYHSEILK